MKTLIERADKLDLLRAMWVIDRARCDPEFQRPTDVDYPQEFFDARIPDAHAIYGWEVETLVTEALYWPERAGDRVANPKAWAYISTLVNTLRKIENFEYATNSAPNIQRELMRIAFRQFVWQSPNWQSAEFVRWWSIMAHPELSSIFQSNVGISFEKFVTIGVLWNQLFNKKWQTRRPTILGGSSLTGADLDSFLDSASCNLSSAQSEARATRSSSDSTAYRKGILRRTPIVGAALDGHAVYIRPIEKLLKSRISSGLYYDVISNQRASNLIGQQFEIYLIDLLAAKFSTFSVTGEFEYGPKKRRKKSPDVMLNDGNQIRALFECKVAKLPYAVQTSAKQTPEHIRVIQDIAKGVAQICAFEDDMRTGIAGDEFSLHPDFLPLVVTLDDWIFFGKELKDEIFSCARSIAQANGTSTDRIDNQRVILCTASDLETILTLYESDTALHGLNAALDDQHKGNIILSVFSDLGLSRMGTAANPLADRITAFFDRFLRGEFSSD